MPNISAVQPLRAHVHSLSTDRANLGGNIGTFFRVIFVSTHPYIYVHRFCVEDFAHTTDDRHETTRGQHNATCTALPHSSSREIHHVRARGESSLCCGELLLSELVICHSTLPHIPAMLPLRGCAAILVVGYIVYVRVASPRYAAASCFCRSWSSVTPLYRIFLLCYLCVGVLRS